MTQSTSRSSFSGSFSIVVRQCSHISRAVRLEGAQLPALGVLEGPVQVLALDVERAGLSSVGQSHPSPAGDVVADLADGPDGVLERHVPEHDVGLLEHAQQDRAGADLEEGGVLAHVRVADDDVQPPVALGVGVRLVAGVDDRAGPRGRARDALPDVLGPLAHAEHGPAGGLEHLAGAGVDLSADEERDQHLGIGAEIVAPAGQVVLVAAVAVARRVGVVLEQIDDTPDALFA